MKGVAGVLSWFGLAVAASRVTVVLSAFGIAVATFFLLPHLFPGFLLLAAGQTLRILAQRVVRVENLSREDLRLGGRRTVWLGLAAFAIYELGAFYLVAAFATAERRSVDFLVATGLTIVLMAVVWRQRHFVVAYLLDVPRTRHV